MCQKKYGGTCTEKWLKPALNAVKIRKASYRSSPSF